MNGGSFQLDEPPPEEPGLLMTSMIDVIFILLAVFICVSEIKKGVLNVDVPEVADVEPPERPGPLEPLVIEITSDDEVYVDGEQAESREGLIRLIGERATDAGEEVKDVPVHLALDKVGRNGTTLQVIGHLSKAGFRKITFPVEVGG